jgi:hypothetical protein
MKIATLKIKPGTRLNEPIFIRFVDPDTKEGRLEYAFLPDREQVPRRGGEPEFSFIMRVLAIAKYKPITFNNGDLK